MTEDLSQHHQPLTNLFPPVLEAAQKFRFTEEQIKFYRTNGYLSGLRILNHTQIEALRAELSELSSPNYPDRDFFYEYNSNESSDPTTVLFHALGAWRVATGFHDLPGTQRS